MRYTAATICCTQQWPLGSCGEHRTVLWQLISHAQPCPVLAVREGCDPISSVLSADMSIAAAGAASSNGGSEPWDTRSLGNGLHFRAPSQSNISGLQLDDGASSHSASAQQHTGTASQTSLNGASQSPSKDGVTPGCVPPTPACCVPSADVHTSFSYLESKLKCCFLSQTLTVYVNLIESRIRS